MIVTRRAQARRLVTPGRMRRIAPVPAFHVVHLVCWTDRAGSANSRRRDGPAHRVRCLYSK
jgi:hypothetical protein